MNASNRLSRPRLREATQSVLVGAIVNDAANSVLAKLVISKTLNITRNDRQIVDVKPAKRLSYFQRAQSGVG
jgi:hypothetical protein